MAFSLSVCFDHRGFCTASGLVGENSNSEGFMMPFINVQMQRWRRSAMRFCFRPERAAFMGTHLQFMDLSLGLFQLRAINHALR